MFELNELELASVVGGSTSFSVKTINSGGSSIAVVYLPTTVGEHGKLINSNTNSGNTILQNSPTYTYPFFY